MNAESQRHPAFIKLIRRLQRKVNSVYQRAKPFDLWTDVDTSQVSQRQWFLLPRIRYSGRSVDGKGKLATPLIRHQKELS